ncbi:MAG: TRAP transporter substrate-binding protein DctP [Candidatus Bathyarchaeia archaeon]
MKKVVLMVILPLSLALTQVCLAQKESSPIYVLKFNDWGPPGIGIGKLHQQAAEMIKKRTNGKVRVDCYFSQSLLKFQDTFRGVSTGVADISLYVPQAQQGITKILSMSFSGLPEMKKATLIYREMLKRHPEFQGELLKNGVKWISLRAMPSNEFHFVTKKPIKSPKDMKGMRIIGNTDMDKEYRQVGASVIQLGPPDWYTSLERGLAQGIAVHYCGVYEFKILELLRSHTHFGGVAGSSPIGFIVNVKVWNSLPKDIQDVITEVYDWVNEESLKYDEGLTKTAMEEAKKMNHVIIELSDSEISEWMEWAKSYRKRVIEDLESKGWPAHKVYESMQELIAKYK